MLRVSLKVLAQQKQAKITGRGTERKWELMLYYARNPWCIPTLNAVRSPSYSVSKNVIELGKMQEAATRSVEHAEWLPLRKRWNRSDIFNAFRNETIEEGNMMEAYKAMTVMENMKLPFHSVTPKVSIKWNFQEAVLK